ncbi:TIGR00730 family Rossman fold protein [Actinomadura coerulea]|uniref:LOG family protein n=1 Tax=Actinomadura coerulea TaxID=46159 RepID=UPI00342DE814
MTEPICSSGPGEFGRNLPASGLPNWRPVEASSIVSDRRTADFNQACAAFDSIDPLGWPIVVYGSARPVRGSAEYKLGVKVGRALAEAGFTVITGGGPGMMEAVNRGAHGISLSIGVNAKLPNEQAPNPDVDVAIKCEFLDIRKAVMERYSRGFVLLPGGYGSYDEWFQALTLLKTGKLEERPAVMVGEQFYGGLHDWTQTVVPSGMITSEELRLYSLVDTVDELVEELMPKHAAS